MQFILLTKKYTKKKKNHVQECPRFPQQWVLKFRPGLYFKSIEKDPGDRRSYSHRDVLIGQIQYM